CRKLEQKGVDKTGFIISSMNCEAFLGVSSAHQHRCNRTAITIDHRIPEPELNLSERWHGPSPLGLPAQFPQRTLPHAVTPDAKGVRCPIRCAWALHRIAQARIRTRSTTAGRSLPHAC